MCRVVDFHTHVLPQMDDGSRTVEESLAMLQSEAAQGIDCVVATPHFYAAHETPERFFARRAAAEEALRAAMSNKPGLPTLMVGAEVSAFEGMSDSEVLANMAIRGTKCVMIEMPTTPWSDRLLRELEDIRQKQGLVPIVAHIDRYIGFLSAGQTMKHMASLPVLVQANSRFFLRRSTQRLACRLLREGAIHLLGSDCHNAQDRPPNLGESLSIIEQRAGRRALRRVQMCSEQIITGAYASNG